MDMPSSKIETLPKTDERTRLLAERMAEAMDAAGVVIVGIREFSKRTSDVIRTLEETEMPVVITRHGRPVATVLPPTTEQLVAFVLANAPRFRQAMEQTEREAAEGSLKPLAELKQELARGAKRSAVRNPRRKSH